MNGTIWIVSSFKHVFHALCIGVPLVITATRQSTLTSIARVDHAKHLALDYLALNYLALKHLV